MLLLVDIKKQIKHLQNEEFIDVDYDIKKE